MENKVQSQKLITPDEVVMTKIYLIRGQKVMLDKDLAELYEIETKRLKEQVRRNIDRFPEDFMFELSKPEAQELQFKMEESGFASHFRYLPFAFTEHGVLMLSSVLNSEKAIQVNIQIMRIYIRIREMITLNKDILHRLEGIERKLAMHDDQIMLIFDYIKQLEKAKQEDMEIKNRNRIGFRSK